MLLSESEINKKLPDIPGWNFEKDSIHKNFILKTFADALAFVVKIGIESEKKDHHPDILIHGWNNVKVILSTHSENGVTENDIILAQIIDKVNL